MRSNYRLCGFHWSCVSPVMVRWGAYVFTLKLKAMHALDRLACRKHVAVAMPTASRMRRSCRLCSTLAAALGQLARTLVRVTSTIEGAQRTRKQCQMSSVFKTGRSSSSLDESELSLPAAAAEVNNFSARCASLRCLFDSLESVCSLHDECARLMQPSCA